MAFAWTAWTQGIAFLFYLIAIAVPNWSMGTVRTLGVDSESGDYNIGLWQVCATNIRNTAIFSEVPGGRDCRYGHCPRETTFSLQRNGWEANGLCESAKSAQAFALLTMLSHLVALYFLIVPIVRREEPLFQYIQVFEVLAAFNAFVTWVIWASWMGDMNGDSTRTRSVNVSFGEQEAGAGLVLMVLGMLLSIWGVGLARRELRNQRREEANPRESQAQLQSGSSAPVLYEMGTVSQSDADGETGA